MIILLHGKDTYRSREKLEKIILRYKEKNKSGINIIFLGEEDSFYEMQKSEKQVSMFKEKRLVVAKNFLTIESKRKEIIENYSVLSSSENIFIFLEEQNVKKTDSFLKKIISDKKGSMAEEFSPLSGKKLISWIKKEIEKNKSRAEEDAIFMLSKIGGENLWKLKNEIDKLSLFKERIEKKDVDKMVKLEVETNIFKTVDSMAENKKEEAISLLYNHIEKGDNPLYLISMIVYQFRNLIIVSELMEKKYSYKDCLSKSNLNSYVFNKTYNQAKRFTLNDLKKTYNYLFEIDLKAKTGQIDPVTALHFFIFSK